MKCPRCVQRIHRAADSCPHCGFTLSDADADFVWRGVKLRRLTDAAGLFRRMERELVEEAIEQVERRFPQLLVAVYTVAPGETTDLRQFGFWLLNRAVFQDTNSSNPNQAGVLILMDPQTKIAAMNYGYLLDEILREEDTFHCLARAHPFWLEGNYAGGLVRLLAHLELVLIKRARQARKQLGVRE